MQNLEFNSQVTILVGENGSGKSTFLEAVACAARLITVGSASVEHDPTLAEIRQLADYLKLNWYKRTHRGFYLRAEDFFGFAKKVAQMKQDLQNDLNAVDEEYQGRSNYAIGLAKMPYNSELSGLSQRYGEGLDNQSHGESFLKLFQARFVPNGFYLLDEPEAPLSPLRQLAFLTALHQMVNQESQFIIATHSPILMAYPNAEILSFDNGKITRTTYKELEHVNLMRAFLNDPNAYLNHLWDSGDE